MEYEINKHYPFSELDAINEWWETHHEYNINEYREERHYLINPITDTVTRIDEETGEEMAEKVVVGEERVEQLPVDENGNPRAYNDYVEIVLRDEVLIKEDKIRDRKIELEEIKKDIEQENFGIIREDFAKKKARAAEIINELRVLEGKEPREIK